MQKEKLAAKFKQEQLANEITMLDKKNKLYLLFSFAALVVLFVFAYLLNILKKLNNIQKETQCKLEVLYDALSLKYKENDRFIKENTENLTSFFHDVKFDLRTIKTEIQKPEIFEIVNTLEEKFKENLDYLSSGIQIKTINIKPIDITQLIESAKISFSREIQQKELFINIQGDAKIFINEYEGIKIFSNIFDNAIKHSGLRPCILDIVIQDLVEHTIINISQHGTILHDLSEIGSIKSNKLGFLIIEKILKKYNGSFQLSGDKSNFSITVTLSNDRK